jgi:hypothetical protein
MDDSVWDVTVFIKNRERLLDGDIAEAFFQAVLQQARQRSLLSDEHFTVDGTLLEAWASAEELSAQGCQERRSAGRSWQCDGGLPQGEAVEPDTRIEDGPRGEDGKERQGQGSQAELQRESGGGEPQRTDHTHEVFEANGTAERDAALVMLEQIPGTKHVTVGGDKAYGTADFVAECRNLKVTPHVAQNLERPGGSAIDGGLIAATFAVLSIWLGLKLTGRGETTVVKEIPVPAGGPFVLDERKREDLHITRRELEILELIAQGLSNREIAEKLFVSENASFPIWRRPAWSYGVVAK